MAIIKPFMAIRPNKEKAARIAALPYDVYNRVEAKVEVEKEPLSFLRIDRPETQFADDMDMYDDLDEIIDKIGAQLIALVPYDVRIPVITQRGTVGLNWSPAMTVFDCLARRIMGQSVDLAFS